MSVRLLAHGSLARIGEMARRCSIAAIAILGIGSPAVAQPKLTNARVTEQAVTRTLTETITQLVTGSTQPVWIAYAMPVENGSSSMCCWTGGFDNGSRNGDQCCGTCRLEPGSGTTFRTDGSNPATRLEPRDTFWGGYDAYFADPDGHLWEVAWNPFWTVSEDGSVSLSAPS